MGLFEKFKEGLKKTKDSIFKQVDLVINSFTKIDEEFFEELEETLIMSDVGVQASGKICGMLRTKVKEKGLTDPDQIKGELKEVLFEILDSGSEPFRLSQENRPEVILVIGVNGVGKTTTIGKLASLFKSEGKKVLIGAADTFRAAAADQLDIWAKRAGADIVSGREGSDPASVVYDTMTQAKARNYDVALIDTAGRLHNKKNLMEELAKMMRIIEREGSQSKTEVLLVIDATTGQNALNQARQFSEVAPVTGLILTKLDGTAKGGVIVAIKEELGVPVLFLGVGEKIDDVQPFSAREFVDALFD